MMTPADELGHAGGQASDGRCAGFFGRLDAERIEALRQGVQQFRRLRKDFFPSATSVSATLSSSLSMMNSLRTANCQSVISVGRCRTRTRDPVAVALCWLSRTSRAFDPVARKRGMRFISCVYGEAERSGWLRDRQFRGVSIRHAPYSRARECCARHAGGE